jgi:hypothetical protein
MSSIPALSDGYHLVAAEAAGVRPSLVTAVYARHIASHQKPDGHWITGDERPPESYSTFTATAIGLRAIQLYSHPNLAADTKTRVERARAWLVSNAPGNTEERTYQLLGLSGRAPIAGCSDGWPASPRPRSRRREAGS